MLPKDEILVSEEQQLNVSFHDPQVFIAFLPADLFSVVQKIIKAVDVWTEG